MSDRTRGSFAAFFGIVVMFALGGCMQTQTRRAAHGVPADVLCGADVLERDHYKVIDGMRVALVTNQTGRDLAGNRLVDLLAGAPNVKLVRLLAPEHGLYGNLDQKIDDTVDPKTKLPVFSIYGKTRRPTTQMVKDVDAIVYDLQDVGARFYTVSATLGLCMEAAAEHHLKMIVLDRPNPITGLIVDGPIADADKLGFTAYTRMPVAHGMTMGELATYYNGELKIGCDLSVVRCENWKRAMWWDETNLPWGNSSPNMRNTTAALLYTGICLLEQCNISVGRGTNQPFEFFGGPWIDSRKLSAGLNGLDLPGVRFVPFDFTPTDNKFKNEVCHGCYLIVTDRDRIEPVKMGVAIVWELRQLFGDQFQIGGVNKLLKNDRAMKAIESAKDWKAVPPVWEKELKEFESTRAKYLMY